LVTSNDTGAAHHTLWCALASMLDWIVQGAGAYLASRQPHEELYSTVGADRRGFCFAPDDAGRLRASAAESGELSTLGIEHSELLAARENDAPVVDTPAIAENAPATISASRRYKMP